MGSIEYIGSLTNPKAHPYVYRTRQSAQNACKKRGYKGLCSKNDVNGWERCAAGWMTNYKGYWMSRTHWLRLWPRLPRLGCWQRWRVLLHSKVGHQDAILQKAPKFGWGHWTQCLFKLQSSISNGTRSKIQVR